MRKTQNPRRAPSSARTGLLAAALRPAALLPTSLLLVALLLATLLVSRAHAQESSWNAIEPTAPGHQNVCVRINDNEATYYLLDTQSPIEFSLRGPGKLRVLSRHLPIAGRTGKRCYTIRVDEDGKLVKAEPQLAVESESALLCDRSGTAGASAETIVSIPDGRHTYQVTVEEHGKAVAARFFRERPVADVSYSNFAPREFERVCTLAREDGEELPHYHFSIEQPLRFAVNGPTKLLARTRLDFRRGEGGPADYGIELLRRVEPGGAWESVAAPTYTTAPEAGSSYKECPELVPGESRRLDIDVPAGTWTYEIRASDTRGRGLSTRILIPKSDIGLGS